MADILGKSKKFLVQIVFRSIFNLSDEFIPNNNFLPDYYYGRIPKRGPGNNLWSTIGKLKYNNKDYFKILPQVSDNYKKYKVSKSKIVSKGFTYRSDLNKNWMNVSELKEWIDKNI